MLKSKNDNVLELEGQLRKLETSLATALSEVEAKNTSVEEINKAKVVVEMQLQETQASSSKLQGEILDINVALSSIQKEV